MVGDRKNRENPQRVVLKAWLKKENKHNSQTTAV
jgi:hypothetical protein